MIIVIVIVIAVILMIIIIIFIIILTRPWPAFGRQGLDGSSGGDLFVSCKNLTPRFAPAVLSHSQVAHNDL